MGSCASANTMDAWVSPQALAHLQRWGGSTLPWCDEATSAAISDDNSSGASSEAEPAIAGGGEEGRSERRLIGFAPTAAAQRQLREMILYGCC